MATPTRSEHVPLARRIARRIRAELAERGLTQTDLAARLGWPQQRLNRRLTCTVPIDAVELEQVAAALGVPVARLIPIDPNEVA